MRVELLRIDRAWIESLFVYVKGKWPHLEDIADPAALESELARIRHDCNTVRLHQGIGYVGQSSLLGRGHATVATDAIVASYARRFMAV